MNKLLIGKINLSKIDKSKLFKGEKGTWMDVALWFSEEPDQYGNNIAIQQSTKKDEPKIFIGSAKFYTPKEKPENNEGKFQKSGKVSVDSLSDSSDLPF